MYHDVLCALYASAALLCVFYILLPKEIVLHAVRLALAVEAICKLYACSVFFWPVSGNAKRFGDYRRGTKFVGSRRDVTKQREVDRSALEGTAYISVLLLLVWQVVS